jgi:hypothetical protein
MNATPKTATSNRNQAPISNRNPNQPTPHVTPTKQRKALRVRADVSARREIGSNRESLRLENDLTPTKQRSDPVSNRELEASFFGPSRGGCFSPPAVRPRLSRRVPPAKLEIPRTPNHQNSNREFMRLEIHVTPTKQRPGLVSNRELEALFSAPVGEGVYLPPGLGLDVGRDLSGVRGASDVQNSNREGRRLETGVTPTKQRIRVSSNRELEPLFTAPALTTRNAGFQITPSARTAQKKAPRHLPRGF